MYSVVKQACLGFVEDNCFRISAAVAYYAAFSLAPMLVLIISVCQLVFEPEDIEGRIHAEIAEVVGQAGAEQVKKMVETSEQQTERGRLATILGIGVIFVGASGVFAQLQAAMNDVWNVRPDPDRGGVKPFIIKRLLSLGMVLTIAFLLMVALVVSAALRTFDPYIDQWLPGQSATALFQAADLAISLIVITVLFAAIFKVLPDARVAWRDVWVGALVTSLMFVVGKFALAYYLGSRNMMTFYGAAGSLVLVLMWVYYSTLILLFGAEFTQAWARQRGREVQPHANAVRIVRRTEKVN